MDNSSEAPAEFHSDGTRSLPRDAFQEIILVLRDALPCAVSDDPVDEARRDRAALAAAASLRPANAGEGRLAAQFVLADSWAADCLKLAHVKRLEIEVAHKCKAQGMSMLREARASLRLLLKLQAVREKIETNAEAANRAAWTEHSAARMMEEALSGEPVVLDEVAVSEANADIVSENATDSNDSRSETEVRFPSPTPGFQRSGEPSGSARERCTQPDGNGEDRAGPRSVIALGC